MFVPKKTKPKQWRARDYTTFIVQRPMNNWMEHECGIERLEEIECCVSTRRKYAMCAVPLAHYRRTYIQYTHQPLVYTYVQHTLICRSYANVNGLWTANRHSHTIHTCTSRRTRVSICMHSHTAMCSPGHERISFVWLFLFFFLRGTSDDCKRPVRRSRRVLYCTNMYECTNVEHKTYSCTSLAFDGT